MEKEEGSEKKYKRRVIEEEMLGREGHQPSSLGIERSGRGRRQRRRSEEAFVLSTGALKTRKERRGKQRGESPGEYEIE